MPNAWQRLLRRTCKFDGNRAFSCGNRGLEVGRWFASTAAGRVVGAMVGPDGQLIVTISDAVR